MNLFFDEESQKLIIKAKEEMYKLKHPYVGSEHLLLAILSNTKLDITKVLNKYGITYNKFKDELIKVVGVGSKSNDWFLFTPLLKRIIDNATYYSKNNNKVVTAYNLFISILQEGDGVANRILISMNVDINALYDKFLTNFDSDNSTNTLFLDKLGINMNANSLSGKYDPVIGRDRQIEQIIQILLRKNKNNPLLLGEAGVGKTAIVEELSRRISLGNVPLKLKNKVIYSISMSSIVAGTKYRGEFEEKITKILDEVVNNADVILFIDEIHTIMGAGGAEGAIDASNILKPYLARGNIRIIGATTVDEYSKFIFKDKALDRRFQKVYVEAADNDMIRDILLGLKPIYETYHNVTIDNNILDYIIDISNNCIFSGNQPDKAIDLLDEVCSYGILHKNRIDNIISKYELQIKDYEYKKNREIVNHNFKKALIYKEKEMKLRNDLNNQMFSISDNNYIDINREDVADIIYNKYNVPSYIDTNKVKKELKEIVYGQDEIIDSVVDSLGSYNFINNKEVLKYLFVGKSGVGKTFLVEEIVKKLFSGSNLISINFLEYVDKSSLYKLIGSAPGYVGYNEGGILDSIKTHPFSIIVIDNISNTKSYLLNIFLESFKKGYILNSKGEKINLTKCIVFMISNVIYNDIGFVEQNNLDSNIFNVDNMYSFNDINKNVLTSFLKKNIDKNKYNDIDSRINYIIDNSNYMDEGFKRISSLCNNDL